MLAHVSYHCVIDYFPVAADSVAFHSLPNTVYYAHKLSELKTKSKAADLSGFKRVG